MIEFNKRYKYRQLCKELNLEPCSGSKQRKQLSDLSKKYEVKKTSTGYYTIKKEYNDLELVENQTYFKNKLYIETLLYTLLTTQKGNVIELDMKELLETLALVNKNFFFCKWNTKEADIALTGSDTSGLSLFLKETDIMLRRVVKDVLNQMEDEQLIKVEEIAKFAIKYKGEDDKWYTRTHVVTDEDEYPQLLRGKQLALEHFGVNKWSDLNFFEQRDAKHIVENYLKETLGVDYYYYSYKIIINKHGINELITDKYEEFRESFNNHIQDKIITSKRKNLKLINKNEKNIYIDAVININTNIDIRNKIKGCEEND